MISMVKVKMHLKEATPVFFAMRIPYNAYHNPYNYLFCPHLSHRSMIIAAP